jgi:hypothetical protein
MMLMRLVGNGDPVEHGAFRLSESSERAQKTPAFQSLSATAIVEYLDDVFPPPRYDTPSQDALVRP